MKKIIWLVLFVPLLAFSQTVQLKSANVKFTGGAIDGVTIGATTPAAVSATTVNGNTITTGTGTLTLAASKIATVNNTLTFAGTDSTTMTFPTTSATIARTDAANTFTGAQTFNSTVSATQYTSTSSSASLPSFNVTGAGIYNNGTNTLGFAANSANIGSWTTTGLTLQGAILAPNLATTSAAQTGTVCWTTGTGNFTVDTTTTCLLSGREFKYGIVDLDTGLSQVMQLRPVSYLLKPKYNPTHLGRQVGFIADEVAKVDKRFVSYDEKGKPHAVRYQQMIALLTKAIQEQQAEIDALKRKLP